jgi:hypothetical protein
MQSIQLAFSDWLIIAIYFGLWYRKPESYAIVSVLVLIVLNIYFW